MSGNEGLLSNQEKRKCKVSEIVIKSAVEQNYFRNMSKPDRKHAKRVQAVIKAKGGHTKY
jgi:hypothetical protein